jgi:hypothetical protein
MRRRRGLFNGWWFDPVDGRRLRRPTRSELSAAPKLWAKSCRHPRRPREGDAPMRESALAKSLRYLTEHRLRILDCAEDAGTLSAEVRGEGRIYVVAHDTAEGWTCSCPAYTENCAHVLASKAVTVLEPRKGGR